MTTKHITLGNQERPIKFGFNALIEFGELTKRSIQQINSLDTNDITLKDLMILCWCALKQGARKEGIPFVVTIEDIGDWLDDSPEALIEITSEFAKARSGDPDQPVDKKKQEPDQSP